MIFYIMLILRRNMDEVEELLQELEDIDTFLSFGVLFPALSSTVNVPLEKQEKKEEQE